MIKFFKRLFYGNDLNDAINRINKIKVSGIIFHIKKVSVVNHIEGAQVLQSTYQTYEQKRDQDKQVVNSQFYNRLKSYYTDLIMASVVHPRLSRKENDGDLIWVDDLFRDWEMVENLVEQITIYSYGKKKLNTFYQEKK